jgi:hypothetical protein
MQPDNPKGTFSNNTDYRYHFCKGSGTKKSLKLAILTFQKRKVTGEVVKLPCEFVWIIVIIKLEI